MAKNENWLDVEVYVPTKEKLDECLAFERELGKKGICFDTGMAIYAKGLAKWRDWQFDWSFKAPGRMTRKRVLAMLAKRGFEYKTESVDRDVYEKAKKEREASK